MLSANPELVEWVGFKPHVRKFEMKIIFLDRDGVINQYPGDGRYVTSWHEFNFLPQVKPALKRLTKVVCKIFIISNQAGVSKGIYSQEALNEMTEKMLNELNYADVKINGVYYCIHRDEDNCNCRKPKIGLIEKAVEGLKREDYLAQDANEYFFVGDTIRDVKTGKTAGCKTILVFSGKEKPENKNNWEIQPDFTAADLSEAVDIIL